MRKLSEQVFRQAYRLELMHVIAQSSGVFCLTELTESLGLGASQLQRPFDSLKAAGLISPTPTSSDRRRFWTRNPSLAWPFAEELVARCLDAPKPVVVPT